MGIKILNFTCIITSPGSTGGRKGADIKSSEHARRGIDHGITDSVDYYTPQHTDATQKLLEH